MTDLCAIGSLSVKCQQTPKMSVLLFSTNSSLSYITSFSGGINKMASVSPD